MKKLLSALISTVISVLRSTVVVIINSLVYLFFTAYAGVFYLTKFWRKVSTPIWTESQSNYAEVLKSRYTPNKYNPNAVRYTNKNN